MLNLQSLDTGFTLQGNIAGDNLSYLESKQVEACYRQSVDMQQRSFGFMSDKAIAEAQREALSPICANTARG